MCLCVCVFVYVYVLAGALESLSFAVLKAHKKVCCSSLPSVCAEASAALAEVCVCMCVCICVCCVCYACACVLGDDSGIEIFNIWEQRGGASVNSIGRCIQPC
jgi:hypothetical protein